MCVGAFMRLCAQAHWHAFVVFVLVFVLFVVFVLVFVLFVVFVFEFVLFVVFSQARALDEPDARVATVAIHLNMVDDAKRLYTTCER